MKMTDDDGNKKSNEGNDGADKESHQLAAGGLFISRPGDVHWLPIHSFDASKEIVKLIEPLKLTPNFADTPGQVYRNLPAQYSVSFSIQPPTGLGVRILSDFLQLYHPLYYDRQGQPLDIDIYIVLHADDNYRVIEQTYITDGTDKGEKEEERVQVSTVWLGLNHGFGDGPPVIFETMIFGGSLGDYQRRYSTEAEARAGHAETVELAEEFMRATNKGKKAVKQLLYRFREGLSLLPSHAETWARLVVRNGKGDSGEIEDDSSSTRYQSGHRRSARRRHNAKTNKRGK